MSSEKWIPITRYEQGNAYKKRQPVLLYGYVYVCLLHPDTLHDKIKKSLGKGYGKNDFKQSKKTTCN